MAVSLAWLHEAFWPRIEIWINSILAFLDKPFFGQGIGGFEYGYAPHRADHWNFLPGMDTVLPNLGIHAGAAHNELLQALVEIGLIGVALSAWLLYRVLANSKSYARPMVYAAMAIALIEFPLQNPASAVLIALGLALCSRPDCFPSAYSRPSSVTRPTRLGTRKGSCRASCTTCLTKLSSLYWRISKLTRRSPIRL